MMFSGLHQSTFAMPLVNMLEFPNVMLQCDHSWSPATVCD
jgi:hypothetical protein